MSCFSILGPLVLRTWFKNGVGDGWFVRSFWAQKRTQGEGRKVFSQGLMVCAVGSED